MVNACYRRQHPDVFSAERADLFIPPPDLPGFSETTEWVPSGPSIPEERMGHPGARAIGSESES